MGLDFRDQDANVCSTMHCWVTLASPCPSVSLSLVAELRLLAWEARQPRSPPHRSPPRAGCGQLQKAWEGPVCSLLSNEKGQEQIYEQKAEVQGPWCQKTWVQIPTLPLTSYVTWGKSLIYPGKREAWVRFQSGFL